MQEGEERPELRKAGTGNVGGSSSDGSNWGARSLERDWGPEVRISGGGGSRHPKDFDQPAVYAADLYINGVKQAELTLLPVEGGTR